MKIFKKIQELSTQAKQLKKAQCEKTDLSFANDIKGSNIDLAFSALNTEEEKIKFCLNLVEIWKNGSKEEAQKVFCKQGNMPIEILQKWHGSIWGMTLTTQSTYFTQHGLQELRIWIERPSSITQEHVDSCGCEILLDLHGPLDKLKRYYSQFTKKISYINARFICDNLLKNGVQLYTPWIRYQ